VKAFEGLNCFYTNADSLPNKLYELKRRVQKATDSFDIKPSPLNYLHCAG
jgi:hypothetical protein